MATGTLGALACGKARSVGDETGTTRRRHAAALAAALTFLSLLPGEAYAGCTSSGGITTCTGDVSGGVSLLDSDTTLNVRSLTQDIAPASAIGIEVQTTTTSDVTIDVETGAFSVRTSGFSKPAILGYSLGGGVTINASGTLITTGNYNAGIHGRSDSLDGVSITTAAGSSISTTGDIAYGIHAWSNGAGASVIDAASTITTTGSLSYGIIAQTAGDASITSAGDISATGDGSAGIFITAGSGRTASVTISSGTVTGGADNFGGFFVRQGAGVLFSGNAAGLLTNSGTIIGDANGHAIAGANGTETIENFGTVTGDVNLNVYGSSNSDAFNNKSTGTFITEDNVNLSTTGTLNNAGTVNVGGTGAIKTTTLTGNLVQTSTGKLLVDADWDTGSADKINVSGTATVAGTVIVNPLNFPPSTEANDGLHKSFTIMTATGGLTNTAIAQDTAAVDFELLTPDANTLDVLATIDFTASGGLTGSTINQRSVGTALNQIVGGGGTLPFVPALLQIATVDGLNAALDQLSPAGDGAAFGSAMTTGAMFAHQLRSCRVNGETDNVTRFIREGQCVWARASARKLNGDGGASKVGFDETGTFFSGGAQFALGGDWFVGGGAGFEQSDLSTNSNATSDTDRVHVGGVLKYNPGPWIFTAALTGGYGWSDNIRRVVLGAVTETASSDTDTSFLAGRVTGAYVMGLGHAYMKPQVELAVTHLERDGYIEDATGGVGLTVAGAHDTVFSVSPSLELGAEYALAAGGVARPFVRAGVTWQDQDEFSTIASFSGPAAAPFEITSSVDEVTADLSVGVDFLATDGMVLRVVYDGRYGEETDEHGGTFKVSTPF